MLLHRYVALECRNLAPIAIGSGEFKVLVSFLLFSQKLIRVSRQHGELVDYLVAAPNIRLWCFIQNTQVYLSRRVTRVRDLVYVYRATRRTQCQMNFRDFRTCIGLNLNLISLAAYLEMCAQGLKDHFCTLLPYGLMHQGLST